MTSHRLLALYLLTALMLIGLFTALELGIRLYGSKSHTTPEDVPGLMAALPKMKISGRELNNQMLIHNVALFGRHPDPASIATAYIGTSRTKVLRPEHFGLPSTVVGAGNSYNEISYGLLLQAEVLRLRFPYLKRVYFETSMLLRRPGRLIVEEDHRKYIPLLRTLSPLCSNLPNGAPCKQVFKELYSQKNSLDKSLRSELIKKRGDLRLASLLVDKNEDMLAGDDPLLLTLQQNGEKRGLSRTVIPKKDQAPEITHDNVKVQRLRDIASNAPWDGLFDLIALWGRQNDIDVVFFQPPVRSDLYRFQVQYGLERHLADIERVSRQYSVPFIDLNRPELGYMDDASLFSDEDHMETCIGSGLLTLALEESYRKYQAHQELFAKVVRHDLQIAEKRKLGICSKLDVVATLE
jgi:hypothetical protein